MDDVECVSPGVTHQICGWAVTGLYSEWLPRRYSYPEKEKARCPVAKNFLIASYPEVLDSLNATALTLD